MTTLNFEKLFQRLAEALPADPSLVDSVMRRIEQSPSKPTPRSRRKWIMREAGASPSEPQVACSAAWPRRWMKHRVVRYGAGLAIVASLLVAMTIIWGRHGDLGASLAFADVQEAIRHIETAIKVSDYPKRPWMNRRVLYRSGSDVIRTEWPSGVVFLGDFKQHKQLVLNPKKKTARTEDNVWGADSMNLVGPRDTPQEFLDELWHIEQMAVERLGEREFDGRKLAGFCRCLAADFLSRSTCCPVFGLIPRAGCRYVMNYCRRIQTTCQPASVIPCKRSRSIIPLMRRCFSLRLRRVTPYYTRNAEKMSCRIEISIPFRPKTTSWPRQ